MAMVLKENEIKPDEKALDGSEVVIVEATAFVGMSVQNRDDSAQAALEAVSGEIGVDKIRHTVEHVDGLSAGTIKVTFLEEVPINRAIPNTLQVFESSKIHVAEAGTVTLDSPPKLAVITGGQQGAPEVVAGGKMKRLYVSVFTTGEKPEEPLMQKLFNHPRKLKRAA